MPQIQEALEELKRYEENETVEGVAVKTPNGDVFIYKSAWDAYMDRNGQRPWLASKGTRI